ncbi:MAG: hypothetical protein JWM33_2172 [Caulobacteraceae bacterium]|nr:hypothetical protein [Caulobacteraceae bacterium]
MKDEDILKEAREAFELAAEREADNRADALDDIRFSRLSEQWPEAVRRQRELEGRPCLTVNKLPAFIRQVVNDARQNKPAIKVSPEDSAADPHTAEIMTGLIRNIERSSDADTAYDIALDSAVTGGFGYFRINTEYACDDSFDQNLVIQAVPNPFSVYGDPYSQRWDSADWNSAFIVDLMPAEVFRRRFKGADPVDWESAGYVGLPGPWFDDDRVRVAEYWTREEVIRKIVALSSGVLVDMDVYRAQKAMFDAEQVSVVGAPRSVRSHKVTQRLLTGAEVLETVDWAGKFIPIVPVYGDEVNLEGKRHFRSLVRDAKDPQRMVNYWRTTATELVALAPKAPFIGPKGAFATDAGKWETANSASHAYIEYDGGIPPQRQAFAGVPAGALQEALSASDDIKAIVGMYDASLGARSNETSGAAITARKIEGDTSTFHFIDNLSRAIRHGGRILVDLIPRVYNTERVIRVLGADGEAQAVPLKTSVGVAGVERIYDLGVGKYDLTVDAGPSFTTKRVEAAEQMSQLIRAYPPAAPVIGDLLAKNLDWPGADEIAKRLRLLLPPQLQAGDAGAVGTGESGAGVDPAAHMQARVQAMQTQQALQAQQAQALQLGQKLQAVLADKSLEQRKLEIDAFKAETERMRVMSDAERAAVV